MKSSSRNKIKYAVTLIALLGIGLAGTAPLAGEQKSPGASGGDELQRALAKTRKYLQADLKSAEKIAQELSSREAAAMLTQILALTRDRNPDIDRLYYLLKQVETMRATEQAQTRLNYLLYVLGFTLFLFTAFFAYVVVDQKRNMDALRLLLEKAPKDGDSSEAETVYRGE